MLAAATDIGIEWCGGDGEDAGEEVARPAVATSCRGGIGSIGGDHVVDRGHVDGVICDADDGGEDHGGDPLHRRYMDQQ